MKNLNTITKIVFGIVLSLNLFNLNAQEEKALKKKKEKMISYQIAKNYFINNSAPEGNLIYKLTSEEAFNKIFGAAATMGKDGQPTAIDFSKEMVIAILSESSSSFTEIKIEKLFLNNAGKLELNYTQKTDNSPTSMKMRVPQILVVDKKYDKELIARIAGTPVSYNLAKRYFVKNTVAEGTLHLSNLDSSTAFDHYFGAAAVMGEDGLPTPIDFEKETAVGIIYHATKTLPNIKIIDVIENTDGLHILYSSNDAEEGPNWRESLILIFKKETHSNVTFTNIKD